MLYRNNPEWVVFNEVVLTNKKCAFCLPRSNPMNDVVLFFVSFVSLFGRYMRDVTAIEPMWLSELAPHFYEFKSGYTAPSVASAHASAQASSSSSSSSAAAAMPPGRAVKKEAAEERPAKMRKMGGFA